MPNVDTKPKPNIKVRIFRLENRLRDKVGGLGAGRDKLDISLEALEKAQAALETLSEDYPDWVSKHIDQLTALAAKAAGTPEKRNDIFGEINVIAHDMKGQGGTFGYILVTIFADSLHKFTTKTAGHTDQHIEIIKAHIDVMRAVIKGRVQGNGGETGKQLIDSLQMAIKKYSPKNQLIH